MSTDHLRTLKLLLAPKIGEPEMFEYLLNKEPDEMALVRRVNRPIFTSPSESTAHTELNHIVNVAPNAPPNLTDMLAAQRLGHLPHFYRPESTYEFQQDGDGWPAGRGMRQGWGGYEAMDTEEEEGAGPSGSQGGSQIWYPNQPDTDFTGSLYPFPGFDTRSSAPTSAPSPPHSTSSPLLNLPPTFSPLERAPSPSPDRPPSVALPAVAGPSSVNEDHCGHCGRETMDETSQRHWAETMWVCGSCKLYIDVHGALPPPGQWAPSRRQTHVSGGPTVPRLIAPTQAETKRQRPKAPDGHAKCLHCSKVVRKNGRRLVYDDEGQFVGYVCKNTRCRG